MKNFLVVLCLFLVGCSSGPDNNGLTVDGWGTSQGYVQNKTEVKNDTGQTIIIINYNDLKSWLESNKNVKIISICGVDRAIHGSTTAWLIVYEVTQPKKCPDCGQALPAEKANQ